MKVVLIWTLEILNLSTLGWISAEHPELLCELLDEIGRKDLMSLVKDYVHKRSSELLKLSSIVRMSPTLCAQQIIWVQK